jgi:hypothetical protein
MLWHRSRRSAVIGPRSKRTLQPIGRLSRQSVMRTVTTTAVTLMVMLVGCGPDPSAPRGDAQARPATSRAPASPDSEPKRAVDVAPALPCSPAIVLVTPAPEGDESPAAAAEYFLPKGTASTRATRVGSGTVVVTGYDAEHVAIASIETLRIKSAWFPLSAQRCP